MKAVRIGGSVVRYAETSGNGRAHIYLAGLGSSAMAAFSETVSHPRLANRRSILVDLLGTGYSDHPDGDFPYDIEGHADTVAAVTDALGLEQCVIIGHSLGGAVAIALAHRHPDRVARLVVCEPNLDPGVGGVSVHIARQTESDFLRRGHGLLLATLRVEDPLGVWPATLATWSPVALHRSSVSLLADRSPTFREQLKAATMPRTFLVGDRSDTPEVLADLPDAGVEMVTVPNAGHAMMDDNPDGFAESLVAALGA